MKLWEYKTFIVGSTFKSIKEEDIQKKCNELGKEGWELVNFSGYDMSTKLVFIFKKEIKETDKDS